MNKIYTEGKTRQFLLLNLQNGWSFKKIKIFLREYLYLPDATC